jgi:peptidylprolyl isomerase
MKNWIFMLAIIALNIFALTPVCSEESQMASEAAPKKDRPVVVIETTQGTFEVTLFPDVAPKAVENFLKHAEDHYYDGVSFHRVIKGFMVQSGDPLGNGTGGESIWGQPFEDEVTSSVTFDKPGYLAMANRGPKTNGSQFFITTAPTKWLNQRHTIFGEVTKGYDVVQKIEATPTDNRDKPLEAQKIISIKLKNS